MKTGLLIAALVLFLLAAVANYAPDGAGLHRFHLVLISLGLACGVGSDLVT
ncbi:MAG: hypothetical protein NVS3B12_30870 [Acidimicrobiales bacterium]